MIIMNILNCVMFIQGTFNKNYRIINDDLKVLNYFML